MLSSYCVNKSLTAPCKSWKISRVKTRRHSRLRNKGADWVPWLGKVFSRKSGDPLTLVGASQVSNHRRRQSKRRTLCRQTSIRRWDQASLRARTANLSKKKPWKARGASVGRWRAPSINQHYSGAASKPSISGRETKRRSSLNCCRSMGETGKWSLSSCQDEHPNNAATISKTTSTNSI